MLNKQNKKYFSTLAISSKAHEPFDQSHLSVLPIHAFMKTTAFLLKAATCSNGSLQSGMCQDQAGFSSLLAICTINHSFLCLQPK